MEPNLPTPGWQNIYRKENSTGEAGLAAFGKKLDDPLQLELRRSECFAEVLVAFYNSICPRRAHLYAYPRVDFELLPSGQRQVVFYAVVDGLTNRTSNIRWGKPHKYR